MDPNKDFYIGWSNNTPLSNRRLLKIFIALSFLISIIIAILFVYYQKPFNQHKFTLGNLIEIEGILHKFPKPIIEVKSDQTDTINQFILLVGYGKFGAEGIIEEMEKKYGDLEGKKIKLIGSPIKGDDKFLLELSKKNNSLIHVYDDARISVKPPKEKVNLSLFGEIIDPKCYFGVMKPGEGKIHKSCAIRCLSGGIPAVFKTKDISQSKYYIILGPEGENINKNLLEFVAEDLSISGEAFELNGWHVIQISPDKIQIDSNVD